MEHEIGQNNHDDPSPRNVGQYLLDSIDPADWVRIGAKEATSKSKDLVFDKYVMDHPQDLVIGGATAVGDVMKVQLEQAQVVRESAKGLEHIDKYEMDHPQDLVLGAGAAATGDLMKVQLEQAKVVHDFAKGFEHIF